MGKYKADKYVEVNGLRIHYAEAGEGRPVVLLHGNGEDHNLFETEIGQLVAAGYRVYAPDSRGHGKNEPLTEYHYADMAEDVYQFIKTLGLEKPALYGHSDGGIIALLLEINHPGTLGAMAVSGTNLSPAGLVPSFLEEFTEMNEKHPDPLVTLMLTEPHIDPEQLRSITIPVLVTVGDDDLILPEETQHIAALIPGARLQFVEGEDHGSYIVHSTKIADIIRDFALE